MTLFNSCKVIARITEAKTKSKIYHVLRDANQLVLNYKRKDFRDFHIFGLSLMTSSHRTPPIAPIAIKKGIQ